MPKDGNQPKWNIAQFEREVAMEEVAMFAGKVLASFGFILFIVGLFAMLLKMEIPSAQPMLLWNYILIRRSNDGNHQLIRGHVGGQPLRYFGGSYLAIEPRLGRSPLVRGGGGTSEVMPEREGSALHYSVEKGAGSAFLMLGPDVVDLSIEDLLERAGLQLTDEGVLETPRSAAS